MGAQAAERGIESVTYVEDPGGPAGRFDTGLIAGPYQRASRWRLRNWRLSTKLIAILLIPTIAALALGGLRVRSDILAAGQLGQLATQVQLQYKVAEVVRRLQEERDLATIFSVNRSVPNKQFLVRQQQRVDDAVSALTQGISDAKGDLPDEVGRQFTSALDQVNRLKNARNVLIADSSKYPSTAVQGNYTVAIVPLLALASQTVAAASDRSITQLQLAADAIAKAKEQAAIKTSLLTGAFLRNSFAPGEDRELLDADARMDAAIDDFRASATEDQRGIFDDTVTGLLNDKANNMEETAIALAGGPLNQSSEVWRTSAVAITGTLSQVQNKMLDALSEKSTDAASDAQASAIRDSAVVLFVLILALVMTFFVARSLLVPLRVLRTTALQVADRWLPEAVRTILASPDPVTASKTAIQPVPVHTTEELGEVARSFDVVHGEAVRLAAEQALLRENVNAMFVNLSRRSQALVERQLSLIDKLERDEQDPDQLSNLFELDHLATRMRRNSENLLVLSGTDLTRRLTKPVPISEVLGAAQSEVEQYARVQVAGSPDLAVQGRAVNDLVHLIAELLDNATAFSDPETQVQVRSSETQRGELYVEIYDQGVGLKPAELSELNQRLAEPPEVDVAVSRRMGLYVVARLAKRHDIKVRLRGNDEAGSGVRAVVLVPADLVSAMASTGFVPAIEQTTPPPSQQTAEQSPPTVEHSLPNIPIVVTSVSSGSGEATGIVHLPELPDEEDEQEPEYTGDLFAEFGGDQRDVEETESGWPGPQQLAEPEPEPQDEIPEVERTDVRVLPQVAAANERAAAAAAAQEAEAEAEPQPQQHEFVPSHPMVTGKRPDPGLEDTSAPTYVDAPTERLPIYEEVLSQWFKSDAPNGSAAAVPSEKPDFGIEPAAAEQPEPEEEPKKPAVTPSATSAGTQYIPVPANGNGRPLPKRPERPERPERVERPEPATIKAEPVKVEEPQPEIPVAAEESPEWSSPGDAGWEAAQALLEREEEAPLTPAGLPKRVPKANLVPGSAGGPKATRPAAVGQGTVLVPRAEPRSAEKIRGRFSNFQQGLRRGRHEFSPGLETSGEATDDSLPVRGGNHEEKE
ncbi:HAMP domain-containing protein [Pseudonocardiaceae bacterium YIM PH 21723]|nr:HAMP domain-containing protein [Pseudonocardiaceae bacterium YIM PH 21723]